MAAELGADSLNYVPTHRLLKALGLPEKHLCTACISTQYPTVAGNQRYQEALAASGIVPDPARNLAAGD